MPQSRIEQMVRDYVTAYYRTLREYLQQYVAIIDAFPEALKGAKHIIAVHGVDGIVVIHGPAAQDMFEFHFSPDTMKAIVANLSQGNVNFNYDSASGIDFEIADVHAIPINDDNTIDINAPRIPLFTWHRVEIVNTQSFKRWNPTIATAKATQDILLYVSARLLHIQQQPDPTDAVLNAIQIAITGFENLLKTNPREEELQIFLNKNPILLEPTAISIQAKIPLGSDYITDFVIRLSDQRYVLVEIEPSNHPIFTKQGDPSARLSHAQRQVEDWREWIHENINYARAKLPDITDPECWIVIGRATIMNDKDKKALARKNAELQHISIMTYDHLIQRAKSYLDNLRRLKK